MPTSLRASRKFMLVGLGEEKEEEVWVDRQRHTYIATLPLALIRAMQSTALASIPKDEGCHSP